MIEEILAKVDIKSAAVFAVAVVVLLAIGKRVNADYRIRQLGGKAYRVKTWLPFGTFICHLQ